MPTRSAHVKLPYTNLREATNLISVDQLKRSLHPHPLSRGPEEYTGKVTIRTASKMCLTEFTQRVMSGKLLQLKQYQNQLAEAENKLRNTQEENRAMVRLLKRQEAALRRYEGENAGIPRLVRSHAEEVRALRMTVHQLRTELRATQEKLREKDAQVINLKDALAKLRVIAEEKKLFDQEKAEKKITELEGLLEEQKKEIQMITRQLLLESKNSLRQLNAERARHKETKQSLEDARSTITRLERENRVILLGYTTSNRPIAHQCCPPLGIEPQKNNQLRQGPIEAKRGISPAKEKLGTTTGGASENFNFQPNARSHTPIRG